jgi:hypothetical protein
MSDPLIAAVVYADKIYPDRAIACAIEPLRASSVSLAGALQIEAVVEDGRHPCDMLLLNLASGEVAAIAEERGRHAQGCRLDVGILTEMAEAIECSLQSEEPRLLVVNKFGKVEADGGGLRSAIAGAVSLGIPVLVGVPARNLDRWRAFAGAHAIELPVEVDAISAWLATHELSAASNVGITDWSQPRTRAPA